MTNSSSSRDRRENESVRMCNTPRHSRDTVATHYNLLCGSGLLEKGSLYAHGYHARSPSNNEATGCRPHHTLYDRLCNLDGPYNPTCQPFTPTGHFMAADQADRTRPFYESLLKTNRESARARS